MLILCCGKVDEGKVEKCGWDVHMRLRKTRKLLFQKPRDECILRMTGRPVIWRAI